MNEDQLKIMKEFMEVVGSDFHIQDLKAFCETYKVDSWETSYAYEVEGKKRHAMKYAVIEFVEDMIDAELLTKGAAQ